MNGQMMLYVDQYGGRIYADTIRSLREQCGGGKVFKIYQDKKDGRTVQTGYGVGPHWFTMYKPVEIEQ